MTKTMMSKAVAVLAAAVGAPALAQTAPPPFLPDRAAENYAFLRDPARRGDWSDGYKFIPLDARGASYLSLGGELRERAEVYHAPRFGLAGGSDDSYLLQRVLVHADLHLGPAVRIFAQLGAHEAIGKEAVNLNAPDEDRLDVQQLFAEFRPTAGLALRLGRQEMALNSTQRFVSFRDGTNVRQNFDGGRLTWSRGPLRIEAFVVSPVALRRGTFDDGRNRAQVFAGLYTSRRLGEGGRRSLDAYYFLLGRDNIAGTADETRHSLGLRYAGTSGAFDWDAEGVYQFGRSAGRGIGAWAASADLGYSIPSSSLRPRLGLRLDAGSGDDNPADARAGGFLPLFPSGPYFNEANLTSWTNLVALRPSLRVQPTRRLTLQAAVQWKWREDRDDAVYLGPSAALAATRVNREREIGQVYSLDAVFQVNRNLSLRAYYLHHAAGDAIWAAGGRAIDFGMAAATLRF